MCLCLSFSFGLSLFVFVSWSLSWSFSSLCLVSLPPSSFSYCCCVSFWSCFVCLSSFLSFLCLSSCVVSRPFLVLLVSRLPFCRLFSRRSPLFLSSSSVCLSRFLCFVSLSSFLSRLVSLFRRVFRSFIVLPSWLVRPFSLLIARLSSSCLGRLVLFLSFLCLCSSLLSSPFSFSGLPRLLLFVLSSFFVFLSSRPVSLCLS